MTSRPTTAVTACSECVSMLPELLLLLSVQIQVVYCIAAKCDVANLIMLASYMYVNTYTEYSPGQGKYKLTLV